MSILLSSHLDRNLSLSRKKKKRNKESLYVFDSSRIIGRKFTLMLSYQKLVNTDTATMSRKQSTSKVSISAMLSGSDTAHMSSNGQGTGSVEHARVEHGHFVVEHVPIAALRPHPRNYKQHPASQLAHLQASIAQHGLYRNVVISADSVLLAGHGVVAAAQAEGRTHIPAVRLRCLADSDEALHVLVADNEVQRLALSDDRALTELLKGLYQDAQDDTALLGTGFDAAQLAALTFVTRPASEIADKDEAAEWVGMPGYTGDADTVRLVVTFADCTARDNFLNYLNITVPNPTARTISTWYPPKERDDVSSVEFEG